MCALPGKPALAPGNEESYQLVFTAANPHAMAEAGWGLGRVVGPGDLARARRMAAGRRRLNRSAPPLRSPDKIVAETPGLVTALGGERTLRETPGLSMDDRLRATVPGFTLFRRSSSVVAHPTTQGVSLRGLGSSGASRTLVLLDGIPMNDPFGGWVYWDRFAPDELAARRNLARRIHRAPSATAPWAARSRSSRASPSGCTC